MSHVVATHLYGWNASPDVDSAENLGGVRLLLDIEAAHEIDQGAVSAVTAGVGHSAPLHTGVILLVGCAVEIFILAPVFVSLTTNAATLKVLLDQVDYILEVQVIPVTLYQLI